MSAQNTILIDEIGAFTQLAWLTDGELIDYQLEAKTTQQRVGDVYLGQIERVITTLSAAFVDIGEGRSAFLPLPPSTTKPASEHGRASALPASGFDVSRLYAGQRCVVQLKRLATSSKAARLTTDITLAGTLLIYCPNGEGVTVSKRIVNKRVKQSLRAELLAWIEQAGVGGGFIIRSTCNQIAGVDGIDQSACIEALRVEALQHHSEWQEALRAMSKMAKPSCLVKAPNLVQRALLDTALDTPEVIFSSLEKDQWLAQYSSLITGQSSPHAGALSLFDAWDVGGLIDSLFMPQVNLPSGGSLVFDRTEAMTSIDVNSGSATQSTAKSTDGSLARQTNLEACLVLAEQIRLRNLGGLLVIDFINMPSDADRQSILKVFVKALKQDSVHSQVSGFSQFGLVEMQRSRSGSPLIDLVFETCPQCRGAAHIQSPLFIAHEILRELVRIARIQHVAAYSISTDQSVIDALQGGLQYELENIKNKFDCELTLSARTQHLQSNYDIVLA